MESQAPVNGRREHRLPCPKPFLDPILIQHERHTAVNIPCNFAGVSCECRRSVGTREKEKDASDLVAWFELRKLPSPLTFTATVALRQLIALVFNSAQNKRILQEEHNKAEERK